MKRKLSYNILICFCLCLQFASGQDFKQMMDNPGAYNFYDIQKKAKEYFKEDEGKEMQKRIERMKGNQENDEKEFEGEYFQYKRWEWFAEKRLSPSGKIFNYSAKEFDEFLKQENAIKNASSQSRISSVNGSWTPIGPVSYTSGIMGNSGGIGRINCIAFHPTNANTIWVGTPAGGLWKTTNNGTSWTSLTDGIPNLGISGICVNSTNTNTIYILTGDGDAGYEGGSGTGNFSIGVLKSTNGGTTWKTTGLYFDVNDKVRAFKLLIHPSNNNILFAILSSGIFKTTNGGTTWNHIRNESFFDAEFKPNDPTIMYAVTANQYFRSYDTGDSWQNYATGLPQPPPPSDRMTIAVSPADPAIVYLAYAGNEPVGFMGLYRSDNSGLGFFLKSDTPNIMGRDQGTATDSSSQADYDFTLGVDRANAGIVYLGGIDLWKSVDNGVMWTLITHWYEIANIIGYNHADQHALEINPLNNRVYTGSDGGVYYSADAGDNWNNITNGLQITQIYKIADYDPDPNYFIIGTQDNGSDYLDNGSLNMEQQLGGDGMECIISHTNPSVIYAAQPKGDIWKSITGGATFIPTHPPDTSGGDWVTPYIMDPTNENILYFGYDTIWKTDNGGITFNNVFNSGGANYVAMAMGTSNTGRIYACTKTIVRMSNDSGASWTTVTGNLPVGSANEITNICVSTTNSMKAWVTFSGFTSGTKVWETVNAGTSWSDISGNLPNVPVNCITVVPGTTIDELYIGTDLGVYYRDDNIGDWVPFRNGLPNVIVNDLEINISANKIRAATFGRGIWESDLFSSCPSDYNLTTANNIGSGCFQHYNSSNSITSSRTYLAGTGCDILYNAGNHIDLKPGFEFRTGGNFVGYIEGCGNIASPSVTSVPLSGTYDGEMDPEPDVFTDEEIKNRLAKTDDVIVYPNPFSNSTQIAFKLDKESYVTIEITDITGRVVDKFVNNKLLSKGDQSFQYEAGHLTNGVYLIAITTERDRIIKSISKTN